MSESLKSDPIILTQEDLNLCLGSGELLRCPFCGARPMSSGERTANQRAIRWTIQCTGARGLIPICFASVIGVDADQAKARSIAVARWNLRTELGELTEARKQIESLQSLLKLANEEIAEIKGRDQ